MHIYFISRMSNLYWYPFNMVILLSLGISGSFVAIIWIVVYLRRTITISCGAQAQSMLKSSKYGRHKPNAWLIKTLSIVNPFTVSDQQFRNAFKNKVVAVLLRWSNDDKYEHLVSTIRIRMQHRLQLLSSLDGECCLSTLAKQATLDSFLSGILDINPNEDLLTELPDLIMHLWKDRNDHQAQLHLRDLLHVNKPEFAQSIVWQEISKVLVEHRATIARTTTNDFDEKISNPLNIIVPGWETMWRVVFYSLLELIRRPVLLDELRQELKGLIRYRDSVLLKSILKETLRLYPPTKSIHRAHIVTGQKVRIAVDQIHRDPNVWGHDALIFRPERFMQELTSEQKKNYLPFSISCPARHTFAYSFAGVIVAVLLEQCSSLGLASGHTLPSIDHLLELGRDSYSKLQVVHV